MIWAIDLTRRKYAGDAFNVAYRKYKVVLWSIKLYFKSTAIKEKNGEHFISYFIMIVITSFRGVNIFRYMKPISYEDIANFRIWD